MSAVDTINEQIKAGREREKKLRAGVTEVLDLSSVYNSIVQNLLSEYTTELDSFSTSMDLLVKDIRSGRVASYSELQLEMRCIVLSQAMYKASEGLGVLGGQSDMARMTREQKFAQVYKSFVTGTIPDKKALAEEYILDEKQIEGIFQRAYNTLAAKVKAANRVLEAVKKVLTSRMIALDTFRKELSDEIKGEYSDNESLTDESVEGMED